MKRKKAPKPEVMTRAKKKAAARRKLAEDIASGKVTPATAQALVAPVLGPVTIVDLMGSVAKYARHQVNQDRKAVIAEATRILGSAEAARHWLATPKTVLGNETPTEIFAIGRANQVLKILHDLDGCR